MLPDNRHGRIFVNTQPSEVDDDDDDEEEIVSETRPISSSKSLLSMFSVFICMFWSAIFFF